ncbi:MAG: fatty acid desaturase [Flavipsychrobacter sp.]|nr:fatty acid desaturase [Flavipsychrobacter sp.]
MSGRNGKELILATKPFAREDKRKSWLYLVTTLLLLLGSLSGTFLVPLVPVQLCFSVLTALLMVRMFVIYHDFLHHTILHRSPLASAIMYLYGILVLVPPSIWKRSHDYHHNHNSKLFSASIGSYPIASKKKFLSMTRKERTAYLAVRHPLTIILGYFSMFMFGMCVSSFLSSPSKHYDSLLALILHFTISTLVVVFFGWQVWLISMFVPFLVSSAIGAYLFYAQHNFPDVTFADNCDWKYENAALESSSYMVMNPFLKWCTANIGYHHVHHLNSRIPFYRLEEAMNALPELQAPRVTYFSLPAIIACFRLKVWDPEKNRMIGLKEL